MPFFDEPLGPITMSLDPAQIPTGTYLAELQTLRLDIGPSGHPYYEAAFTLCEPEEFAGRWVYSILSFHPRSRVWTIERLTAIAGHPLPRGDVNLRDKEFQQQFIRRRARLRIGMRQAGLGREEPDVQAIYPATPKEDEYDDE